jgi:spore maturation protein CgeB
VTILLSGALNPRFEALPEALAAALRRLGHRVTTFDHRGFLLPGRLRARLPALEALDRRALNRRFVRAVARLRPDRVLVNQGMVLEPESIARARSLGARCVNWFSDYPAEFEAGLRAAPAYDAFYLASSYAASRHRAAGHAHAAWLPFGCDPVLSRAVDRRDPPGADAVVFVGSWYPERQILLRFLRGLAVGVWGPGWERAAGDPHLRPMLRGSALRPAAWRALYARARVVLNIHYGCFGPREAGGDLANTRVFEILASGAYQVVDRQGDVLRLFREREHLAAFSGGDELRERVEEALRDEGMRRAVAARGRAAVLAGHTYDQRARRLIEEGAPRDLETDAGAGRGAPGAPAPGAAARMASGGRR